MRYCLICASIGIEGFYHEVYEEHEDVVGACPRAYAELIMCSSKTLGGTGDSVPSFPHAFSDCLTVLTTGELRTGALIQIPGGDRLRCVETFI